MAAPRTQYFVVGKYVDADDKREVVGYHLKSADGSKQGKFTVEQMAYLAGRDQLANCTAQLYKDRVLFRGKGVSLDSLPSQLVTVRKPAKPANSGTDSAVKNSGQQGGSNGSTSGQGGMTKEAQMTKSICTQAAQIL